MNPFSRLGVEKRTRIYTVHAISIMLVIVLIALPYCNMKSTWYGIITLQRNGWQALLPLNGQKGRASSESYYPSVFMHLDFLLPP